MIERLRRGFSGWRFEAFGDLASGRGLGVRGSGFI